MQNKFGIYLDIEYNRRETRYALTCNKIYEILSEENSMWYVITDNGNIGGFNKDRFKIIEGNKETINILYGNKNK